MQAVRYNSPIQDFILIGLTLYVKTKIDYWHSASDNEKQIIKEAWGVIGI